MKKYELVSILFPEYVNYNETVTLYMNPEYSLFKYTFKKDYNLNNFCFVMAYIYIKKKYPEYNSHLLFYVYRLMVKEKKFFKFFTYLLNIINSDDKNNIEKHLFLIKNKDIPKSIQKSISNCYKRKESQEIITNKLLVLFMELYLMDLNYTKNSFVFKFIKRYSFSHNINITRSIIFNYNYTYQENDTKKQKYIYELINKFISEGYSFYEMIQFEYVKNELNFEKKINKRIKNIENIFKQFTEQINPKFADERKYYWENFEYTNWFIGLYYLIKNLKKEKKNLFDLYNNNLIMIKDTLFALCNLRRHLLYRKKEIGKIMINIKKEELSEKINFLLKEIHDMLYDYLSNEKFIQLFKAIENEEKEEIKEKEKNDEKEENEEKAEDEIGKDDEDKIHKKLIIKMNYKLIRNVFEIFKYYIKEFSENLNNIKRSKIDFNNYFNQFKSILTNIISFESFLVYVRFRDFFNILIYLFHQDTQNFYILLKMIKNYGAEFYINKLLNSLVKKDTEKFFANYSEIKNILEFKDDWYKINGKKSSTFIFILNNSLSSSHSNLDFINNFNIFNDINSAYNLLTYKLNKEASIFVLKKIEEKFNKKNNIEKIIDIMDRVIYNEYVIEYLFNSLKDNDIEELIKSGKYINKIMKSLFTYTEINGYLLIKILLDLLKKYHPSLDLKNLILPPPKEPYDNKVNLCEILSIEEKHLKKINKKAQYLLYYAFNFRMIINHEVIAILLEYCSLNEGIQFIIQELMEGSIDTLFNNQKKIKYIESFLNITNDESKIKKIKDLGNNFYDFLIFVKSIINYKDYLYNLNDIEKYIFINYIKIFILEIIPYDLLIFEENDKDGKYLNYNSEPKNRNSENKVLFCDEKKLLILLSLYEIKGEVILSIKNKYHSFYSRIETIINKYRNDIKINKFCLKTKYDIEKFNKIKNIISIDYNFFILWRYPFQLFPNFMNLITIRKNPYYENEKLVLYNEYSIETLIFDLLRNNNIKPFYESNSNNFFHQALFSDKYELRYRYQPIIYSLLDFTKTSIYIIENRKNLFGRKAKFWKTKDSSYHYRDSKFNESKICVYIEYLDFIKEISNYILTKYDDNNNGFPYPNIIKDNLESKDKNKLKLIKDSIHLEQISLEIFKILEPEKLSDSQSEYKDPEYNEYFNVLKTYIKEFLKNNKIMKEFNRIYNEEINIINYFKYLKLACHILLYIITFFDKMEKYYEKIYFNDYSSEYILNDFHFTYNKTIPKEESIKAYNELIKELNILLIDNSLNIDFEEILIKTRIPLYYYFNIENEEFLEALSGKKEREEFFSGFLEENLEYIYNYKKRHIINFDIKNKIKNMLFNEFYDVIYCRTGINISDKNINYFIKEFEPFYNKYYNFILNYSKNLLDNIKNYVNYESYKKEIISKFKNYFEIYLYPCIQFNRKLYIFLNNLNYFVNYDNIEEQKEEIYINFYEMINSIMSDKYYKNENLDKLFKIRAVNYIINDNSNLNLFINELYSIIYKKENKTNDVIFINKKNVKEYFTIKIEKGKKVDMNDAIKLLKNDKINNNKNSDLRQKNSNKIFSEKDAKSFYSIICNNPYKKELIPSSSYKGYIPYKIYTSGKTNEYNLFNTFQKTILIKDKLLLFDEINNNKKLEKVKSGKKIYKTKEFINVFNLMFSVKCVENNVVILQKNDITKILNNYSKDDITFMNFISNRFHEEENNGQQLINWQSIKIN